MSHIRRTFSTIDEFRKYQETILRFSHDVSDKINHYVNHGVDLQDAKIMANFSFLLDKNLTLANDNTQIYDIRDDMHWMFHYKINNDGRITELHIHQTETIFLTLFPKILCSLDQLEIIRFPNNFIENVPECILNLKNLREFDVSNLDRQNPIIPDSIKSYIESLEKFNVFYEE
jgi:hypothetical protein